MTTLVLGAGQVGTYAARSLEELGETVIAADLKPSPGFFWRFGPRGDVPLRTADMLDSPSIFKLASDRSIDRLVLATGMMGRACAADPKRAWIVNVEGPASVAETALEAGITRLVFVSSFVVYGNPTGPRIPETTPPDPQSVYGRTKAAAEKELVGLRGSGLDVRILRACGTYGPLRLGKGSKSARFIEALLTGAVRMKKVTLRAPAGSTDEYIYVKDLGRAIAIAALTEENGSHFLFNVGAGRRAGARDLASAVEYAVSEAEVTIEDFPPDDTSSMPPLDVTRIRDTLGFEPSFGLNEGFKDYLRERARTR